MKYVPLYFILMGVIVLSGNSFAQKRLANQPEAPPLLKRIFQNADMKKDIIFKQPAENITLIDALSIALLNNPTLAVYFFEMRAKEAQTLQASLRPNPEIGVQIENFAGSTPFQGFSASELTLSVGQLIEVGGKRSKRTEAAALESDAAAWDFEAARLLVYRNVVKSFTAVLVAQKKIELQSELVEMAEQFLERIEYRVKTGNLSSAEAARARVELASNRILLERAKRELISARYQLAATWGGQQPVFVTASGDLDSIIPVPPLEDIKNLISQNPQTMRWQVEMERRAKMVQLEKAKSLPDPIIAGGYRRLNDADAGAFVMSLSIPLQLFDHNQGNIHRAQVRKQQAEYQKNAVELEINTILTQSYNRLVFAVREVGALKTDILPQAENAYQIINKGYNMGKFSFLDVLDAQRTLYDVRSRHLTALREYHFAKTEVEQLIGKDLSSIQKKN